LIDPDPLPSWLTEADLDVYCQAYRDGFRGPINWYRGYRGYELLCARGLEHAKITQPCHLMVGRLDPSHTILADAFVNVDQNATDLRGNILLGRAGHWLPLERTKEVNAALLDFLSGLSTYVACTIN
jgi:pimeloyl-ACP methyl ester carboxylesterase